MSHPASEHKRLSARFTVVYLIAAKMCITAQNLQSTKLLSDTIMDTVFSKELFPQRMLPNHFDPLDFERLDEVDVFGFE